MGLDSIISVILLVSLLVFFIRSAYFRYKDLKYLLAAFTLLTLISVLNATVFVAGIPIHIIPIMEVIVHGVGSLAAWFFAWDAYLSLKLRQI